MTNIQKRAVEISYAMFPSDFSGEKRRCFHYSFLFDKTKLLCVAENNSKTHPRNRFNTKFDLGFKQTCSEMAVFVRAKNKISDLNWSKLTLLNVRIARTGQLENSKCCPACHNLITYLGIKSIYHTNDMGDFVKYNYEI